MTQTQFNEKVQQWMGVLTRYGALFENLRFQVNDYGISVHVIDAAKPYHLVLPVGVLLPFTRLTFTDDGYQLDGTGMPADMLVMWQEILDFVLSDDRIAGLQQVFAAFYALPETIKAKLESIHLAEHAKCEQLPAALARKLLIQARYFNHNGQHFVMPVLDFVNHSPLSDGFIVANDSISIKGSSTDEVCVNYSKGDAFALLSTFHFPAQVNYAYSLGIKMNYKGHAIEIKRNPNENHYVADLAVPKMSLDNGTVVISSFMLGNKKHPTLPLLGVKAALENAQFFDTDNFYRTIYRFNVQWFLQLLGDLEGVQGLAADWLRQTTYQHLALMAEH